MDECEERELLRIPPGQMRGPVVRRLNEFSYICAWLGTVSLMICCVESCDCWFVAVTCGKKINDNDDSGSKFTFFRLDFPHVALSFVCLPRSSRSGSTHSGNVNI